MRGARGGRSARNDYLRHTERCELLEQARHRPRTIRQAVGLAAPESIGRECEEVRFTGPRRSERSAHDVERIVAACPRKIEDLSAPFPPFSRGDEIAPVCVAQHRRDDITARIEIRGDDQELTKARLTEVF